MEAVEAGEKEKSKERRINLRKEGRGEKNPTL